MSSISYEGNTYVTRVLAGDASYDDIEDYISAWHNAPDDSPATELEVYEFLGLTWDEYRLWGEHPESLCFIFRARKNNQSAEEAVRESRDLMLAASERSLK